MKIAKKFFFTFLISTVGLFSVFNSLYSQQTAGELFEKALYLEEAKGNLQEAIDLYKKIIEQFLENREIAAKAQLHIGLCYEKLGLKEAPKAYQKVVDNFPEQIEAVKIAKEKLSILLRAKSLVEKGDKELSIRRVWGDLDVRSGNLRSASPDGRYISYNDRHGGDLALLDLVNKKQIHLTNNWSLMEHYGELYEKSGASNIKEFIKSREKEIQELLKTNRMYGSPVWSPDGKQLACLGAKFTIGGTLKFEGEIYIFRLDGSKPRVVYQNKEFPYVNPLDWSPDGQDILAAFARKDRMTGQAALVSIADGSLRILKTLDEPKTKMPNKVKRWLFSPDGRYIAYDFPTEQDVEKNDIFLLSSDGSHEIPVVRHPAHDFLLCWAPDGKKLVFASDRTGTFDVWSIRVIDGKPQGGPELVKKDVGEIIPLGLTQKGEFYYGLRSWTIDVYTATLDKQKEKILLAPRKASQPFEGSNSAPGWSPDGKYFAYISKENLYIRSLETDKERKIIPELKSFWQLQWAPDSISILVRGIDRNDRNGIYRIDTQTGDVKLIRQFETGVRARWPVLSPDGKKLYYKYRPMPEEMNSRIMEYDLETRKEKQLNLEVSWPTFLALSPDGQHIAFQRMNDKTFIRRLSIIPAAGGERRDVMTLKKGEIITTLTWTPDGQSLLFAKRKENQQKCGLWKVSVDGGEPENLGLVMERLAVLRIHPDGRRIAFCSSHLSSEIWVMENFLPSIRNKK